MKRFTAPRFLCLLVALIYAACGGYQLWSGAESTPEPMRQLLAFLFGFDMEVSSRLIVALEFALAAGIAAAGTRIVSMAGGVTLAFIALASVSGGLRQGAVVAPAMAMLFSIGTLVLAAKLPAQPRRADARRGLSPAWSALAAIAAGTAASHLSARADFRPDQAISAAEAKARAMSIDLDMKAYIGKRMSESPLGTYLPTVVERIGNLSAFIVFYNPLCDACHTVFESDFSAPRLEMVFAIEVPPVKDAIIVSQEDLGPIDCPQCVFDTLPPGPLWLVAPPMTVKVENGVITCVADRFGGDCVNGK
jgi:hypothetical protein